MSLPGPPDPGLVRVRVRVRVRVAVQELTVQDRTVQEPSGSRATYLKYYLFRLFHSQYLPDTTDTTYLLSLSLIA